jgi:hypothetical protein
MSKITASEKWIESGYDSLAWEGTDGIQVAKIAVR